MFPIISSSGWEALYLKDLLGGFKTSKQSRTSSEYAYSGWALAFGSDSGILSSEPTTSKFLASEGPTSKYSSETWIFTSLLTSSNVS